MREPSAIETLSALLQSSHAQPRVRPERLVPSAIYDLDCRVFVIAAAFELHAKGELLTGRRIHATKLKLLQFVAIRPRLLPVIRSWSAIGATGHRLLPTSFDAGFSGIKCTIPWWRFWSLVVRWNGWGRILGLAAMRGFWPRSTQRR